jgi:glyoxylase-like metal-dependent hydrolase (beta-lactamase superfamily II)
MGAPAIQLSANAWRGHVSLLHEDLLVTGDALFNIGFRGPSYSWKFLCADFAMTRRTAHVLGELDYSVAAFTHGPEMKDGARKRIRDFLGKP